MTWTISLDSISSGEKSKIDLENNLDLIVLEDEKCVPFIDHPILDWPEQNHTSPNKTSSKTIKSRLFFNSILHFSPELMGSKLIVHVISFSSYQKIKNKDTKHSTHHLFVIICFSTIFSINDV